MSKKLYLDMKNWPPTRNEKRFERYSPETAEKILRAYLNDEIVLQVIKSPPPRSSRPPRINPSTTQRLIQAAFVIGQRIIRKYCRGEIPHSDRMATWQKALAICDKFEKKQMLPTPVRISFKRNGLWFSGRLYDIGEGNYFVLPENAPKGVADVKSPFVSMPATAFSDFTPLGKKTAARLIEAYEPEGYVADIE